MAHFLAERYEEAVDWAKKAILRKPGWRVGHAVLVASLSELDRQDDAQEAVSDLLGIDATATVSDLSDLPFRDAADLEKLLSCLRNAGLPE